MIISINSSIFVFIFLNERFDGIFLSKIRLPFPWNPHLKIGFQGKVNSIFGKTIPLKIKKVTTNGLLLNFVKNIKKRLYFVRNPDPTAALWGPILPVS